MTSILAVVRVLLYVVRLQNKGEVAGVMLPLCDKNFWF